MRGLIKILALLLCLCLLAGCGSDSRLTAKEIADELKTFSADTVSWTELGRSKISTYFGFSDENITGFKGYINDAEEKFDMIAVFGFEDETTKAEILSGISDMTTQMSENYKLANESVAGKIISKTLAQTDHFVILCIMDQNKKVTEYLQNEVKAEIIA
ncbi:MAG: DUF4358 domain-containing protein [Acutalibacteraceae bacterium]|nr:DUF4358 domain-containing protein [Acutalibacteraceae bacterium]